MFGWDEGTRVLGDVQPHVRRGSSRAERARSRLELHESRGLRTDRRRSRRPRHRDRDARERAVGHAGTVADARTAEHVQPAAAPSARVHDGWLRARAHLEEGRATRVHRRDHRLVAQQTLLSLQPKLADPEHEPVDGQWRHLLRRLGRAALPGRNDEQSLVSLTVTGDAVCRATDKTYRIDTPSAQEFLSRFGLVPAP